MHALALLWHCCADWHGGTALGCWVRGGNCSECCCKYLQLFALLTALLWSICSRSALVLIRGSRFGVSSGRSSVLYILYWLSISTKSAWYIRKIGFWHTLLWLFSSYWRIIFLLLEEKYSADKWKLSFMALLGRFSLHKQITVKWWERCFCQQGVYSIFWSLSMLPGVTYDK